MSVKEKKNIKVEMELLSDALPGSGESEAGFVDCDVIFDDYGLPFIPAKRFKGVLKNSANDLSDWKMITQDVEQIFGSEGDSKTVFIVENGYLEEFEILHNFLECIKSKSKSEEASNLEKAFSTHSINSFYSYLRTQTAVERETQVTKNKSLRISRVLRKGLKFRFDITLNKESYQDFKEICKTTRNFGSSRTRGLGEIKVSIIEQQEQDEKSHEKIIEDKINLEDFCVIELKLTNKEQILVSNLINGQQSSETFIRGSYIRGAMASLFLDNQNTIENSLISEDFKKLFLSDNVFFSNFYPSSNEQIYYPVPFSIVREKGKKRCFDLALESDRKKVDTEDGGIQTEPIGGFTALSSDNLRTIGITTRIESHHSRPHDRRIGHAKKKKKGEPMTATGNYFHYDVIEPNHEFSGCIVGKLDDLNPLIAILPKRMSISLGKSITAQYGKCIMDVEPIKPFKKEIQNSGNNYLVITLTSDMILVNDFGHITPDTEIFIKEFEKQLDMNQGSLKVVRSFLKFKKVGGFNSKWGLPKSQSQSLAAGSVLIVEKVDNTNFDLQNINMVHAFGLRKSEGYGQILINYHGFSAITNEIQEKQKRKLVPIKESKILDDFIVFSLIESMKLTMEKEILKSIKAFSRTLSNSFIQRMLFFIKNSNSIEAINLKLKELKDTAMKQSKKLKNEIYLKREEKVVKGVKTEFYSINVEGFQKHLDDLAKEIVDKDISDSQDMESLPVMNDFYLDKVDELYMFYSKKFLTSLMLKNRSEKK